MLATRGFAVMYPDAPIRIGSPSADLAAVVLPAVNAAVKAGIADPKKLTIFGQSAGGGDTLDVITETNRFVAAAIANGVYDLFSYYGNLTDSGDAPHIRWLTSLNGAIGGDPWRFRNRYLRNSPYQRLDRVHTPLLLLQGMSDETSPVSQADEVFVGLRDLGRPVEYVRYPGEGHAAVYYTPEHYADWWQRIIGWFQRYTNTTRAR
jgi:dipeptidyl aminopeptidase/acylaminoacyl peptidase